VALAPRRSGKISGGMAPIQIVENAVLVSVTLDDAQGATLVIATELPLTLLSPEIATRLGIAPAGPRRTVRLLGGQEIDVPLARLSTLRIGSAAVEDLEVGIHAVARSLPNVDGFLGGDILGRFDWTVNRTARQLRLETSAP